MAERKTLFEFGYRRHPDQDAATSARHPVIVVGAGPVGMSLALDLAQRGVPVVLLDDADRIGEGSRAICFAETDARDLRPTRRGAADARQGRGVAEGQGVPRRRAGLRLRPAAGWRAHDAGLHQSAAVLRRTVPGRGHRPTGRRRSALAQPGRRDRAARRWRDITVETPDGPYRWRATGSCAATARARHAARCSGWSSSARCSRTSS